MIQNRPPILPFHFQFAFLRREPQIGGSIPDHDQHGERAVKRSVIVVTARRPADSAPPPVAPAPARPRGNGRRCGAHKEPPAHECASQPRGTSRPSHGGWTWSPAGTYVKPGASRGAGGDLAHNFRNESSHIVSHFAHFKRATQSFRPQMTASLMSSRQTSAGLRRRESLAGDLPENFRALTAGEAWRGAAGAA